jgi:hypothetical protein
MCKISIRALQIKLNTAGKPLIRKMKPWKSQEKKKKFEPLTGDTLKQLP